MIQATVLLGAKQGVRLAVEAALYSKASEYFQQK